MEDQIIFANSKNPTGFDKVVSSGMLSSYFFQVILPLTMEFMVHYAVEANHYIRVCGVSRTCMCTVFIATLT